MSRYERLGGLGGIVMVLAVVAIVVGVTAPTQGASALTVEASLSENGSIPANDFDTQTVRSISNLTRQRRR